MSKHHPDKLQAVEILWLDAHGGSFPSAEWGKIGKKHLSGEEIRTVGLLYAHTKEGVLLLLSMSDRGNVDAYIFIPAGCITEINYLEEEKEEEE